MALRGAVLPLEEVLRVKSKKQVSALARETTGSRRNSVPGGEGVSLFPIPRPCC